MYNQPHVIHLNNYPKYCICMFIAFILEILSLTINCTEMD